MRGGRNPPEARLRPLCPWQRLCHGRPNAVKMLRSRPLGTEFWEHPVPQWGSEKWQGVLRGARWALSQITAAPSSPGGDRGGEGSGQTGWGSLTRQQHQSRAPQGGSPCGKHPFPTPGPAGAAARTLLLSPGGPEAAPSPEPRGPGRSGAGRERPGGRAGGGAGGGGGPGSRGRHRKAPGADSLQ